MSGISTKDWHAWINLQPGSERKLIVIGKVETSAGNMVPVLRKAVPRGFNPAILILDLSIEQQGDRGSADVAYRDARFETPAEPGLYTSVVIRHDGADIAGIDKIEEAH
jgi:hypothetical protein